MEIRNIIIKNETDTLPNRYVARAIACVCLVMVVLEVLNETGIFMVSLSSMRQAMAVSLISAIIAGYMGSVKKIAQNGVSKYIMMALVLWQVATSMLILEQWSLLSLPMPLLLSVQYRNRRLTLMSCIGTCAIAALSAPIGCFMGLWQPDYYSFLLNASGYDVTYAAAEAYNNLDWLKDIIIYVSLPRLLVISSFCVIIMSVTKRDIKNLSQRVEQTGLSHIDVLTQMYSRLYYEEQMDEYRAKRPKQLICIYADVNSLHEVNNEFGHDEGDILLKNCAAALYNTFGPCVYRVGGDEYVVLCEENCNLLMRIKQVEDIMKEYNCNMSMGYSRLLENEEVGDLVRRCEQMMYAAKRAYYSKPGNDRRMRH